MMLCLIKQCDAYCTLHSALWLLVRHEGRSGPGRACHRAASSDVLTLLDDK